MGVLLKLSLESSFVQHHFDKRRYCRVVIRKSYRVQNIRCWT